MSNIAATVALAGVLLATSLNTAHAFRLAPPASSAPVSSEMAAYDGKATNEPQAGRFLLTPGEVRHIRWCAARYRSYHAVDNTIADRSGNRVECEMEK